MTGQTLYLFAGLFSILVVVGLLRTAWSNRNTPTGIPFLLFVSVLLWWTVGNMIQLTVRTESASITVAKLTYAGTVQVALFWFVFVARLSGEAH